MRIILLVLAKNDIYPYTKAMDEIRKTYFLVENKNIIKKLFYVGGSKETKIDNDTLYCAIEDSLYNIQHKTHIAFKYLCDQNYDFDYLIRVNSGSYVNIQNLCNLIDQAPKNKLYGGVIGQAEFGSFVSGSMYVISNDLVKEFAYDEHYRKNSCMNGHIDDVALSKYFVDKKIKLTQFENYRQDLFNYPSGEVFLNNLNKTVCQYYFRSQNYILFSKIHEKLYGKN